VTNIFHLLVLKNISPIHINMPSKLMVTRFYESCWKCRS